MSTVLITGANRGLGLEFTRQYAAAGWQVLACCRNPAQAEALNAIAHGNPQVQVHALDVAELTAMDTGPEERMARLFAISGMDRAKTGAWIEVAMRTWALTDARARRALEEIDRHRLVYFESVLGANGVPKVQAPARAFLIYSYVIGDTLLSGDRAAIRDICQALLTAP